MIPLPVPTAPNRTAKVRAVTGSHFTYIDPMGLILVTALLLSNSLAGGSGGLGHRNLGRH